MTAFPSVAPLYPAPRGLHGTKGRGLTYERRVREKLSALCDSVGWDLVNHPWLDTPSGPRQPDFVLVAPSQCAIVAECKLTWLDCSAQLSLYSQALSAMGYHPVPLVICRNLTPQAPAPITQIEDAYPSAVWHLWA